MKPNAVILIPGGLGEKRGSQDLERELKARIRAAHLSNGGGPIFHPFVPRDLRLLLLDPFDRDSEESSVGIGCPFPIGILVDRDLRGPFELTGDAASALQLSQKLREDGILVSAIRTPTVPAEPHDVPVTIDINAAAKKAVTTI